MRYALNENGDRVEASRGQVARCPTCDQAVRAKCGDIIVHHWAHIAAEDCDPWAEPDSSWHRSWQEVAPPERREVRMGQHRADIVTRWGSVVELQHTGLSPTQISERESFYGPDMVWIFDVRDAVARRRLLLRRKVLSRDRFGAVLAYDRSAYRTFRWKHPVKSIAACYRPVFLDLGDDRVLRLGRIYPDAPCGGWGKVGPAERLRQWLG